VESRGYEIELGVLGDLQVVTFLEHSRRLKVQPSSIIGGNNTVATIVELFECNSFVADYLAFQINAVL
jgi:CBS-domain-containing membrane protein